MRKSIYLFTLVILLALSGIVETISGFILWFALPSGGGRRGLELTFWGLSRHTWVQIHDWFAIALMAIVVIHLALHWKWVIRMFKQIFFQIKVAYLTLRGNSTVKAN
jgi:hypothetical protein